MKKGQILLITVMLLATVMTVLLSVTFQSTTETQITKLEEESQKALAAAEAAIEAALQTGANVTIGEGSLSNLTGFTGNATLDTTTTNTFISPLITKDGSFTFYLGDYNPVTTPKVTGSTNEDIILCFDSSPGSAVEVTLIKTSGIKKYVSDPGGRIANDINPSSGCSANNAFQYYITIPGADILGDAQVLIVRVLYSSSKLLIARSSDLPSQGKTINSEAKSTTGVSKKVTLFQSYPQIPAEFFSTSF